MSAPAHPGSGERQGSTQNLPDHFFRHASGRLVALLVHRVGLQHLEAVEDAVQAALLAALTTWAAQGFPQDRSAWLYKVAHNHLRSALRKERGHQRILWGASEHDLLSAAPEPEPPRLAREVGDDLLRMLFITCDERIPEESRLVLALKTLCGFSTSEIALRLFTTEANVYKRLSRARERLKASEVDLQTPSIEILRSRLPSVQSVIYLIFNEGYLSTNAAHPIRVELCEEAIRLATLLAEHSVGAVPSTFALLALMHLHSARQEARQDAATGGLLLLEEQDRTRWDKRHLQFGFVWLRRAAQGEEFTRFHAEAGIAAEHCFSRSFAETRWREIGNLYALLERLHPSPVHTLNRAIAIAQVDGPKAGLALLAGLIPPPWLADHYMWAAVHADLHRRAGNAPEADEHRNRALKLAPSNAVRRLLRRRLT